MGGGIGSSFHPLLMSGFGGLEIPPQGDLQPTAWELLLCGIPRWFCQRVGGF